MGSKEESAMDEQIWQDIPLAKSMQEIHSNSVLFYFAASPFFDQTSNNASLYTQCLNNPAMFHILSTRQAFEGRLKTMSGIEFVVSQDPLLPPYWPPPADKPPSNIWVIKKQRRRKTSGPDEVTTLGVYFVVGYLVFMAPKIGDVLASRMLSTVTSLSKLLSTVSTLPIFTPSLGYTYTIPIAKAPTSSGTAAPSTQQSTEGTPLPESQSFNSMTSRTTPSRNTSSGAFTDAKILADSFHRSNVYGNEYMDENSLTGEPGSFIIAKSKPTQNKMPSQPKSAAKNTSVTNPSIPPPPLEVKTDLAVSKKPNQGGQKSPTTPGGSAGGPQKDKPKRKKSKAPVSGQP